MELDKKGDPQLLMASGFPIDPFLGGFNFFFFFFVFFRLPY